jgi:thioredoxin-like negative regulator of GroEL
VADRFGHRRRRFLRCVLLLLGLALPSLTVHAAPVRPLVVVFTTGDNGGPGIEAKKEGDDLSRAERTLKAAQTVRNLLNDSGVVAATLYNPDISMFKRAVQELGIQLINRNSPTDAERAAIGKGVQAVYVVAVSADLAKAGGGVELALYGTDIETRKAWFEKANAANGGKPSAAAPDSNAIRRAEANTLVGNTADNALQSAANTLVTRLLAGPLADFSRPAPPPALLPPPAAATAPAAVPPASPPTRGADAAAGARAAGAVVPAPTSEESEANSALATRKQAETMLGTGDINAAIVMLRKAINQTPNAVPLRIMLTKAYLAARRGTDAASEAQRALTLNPNADRANELELTRLLAQAFALNGDTTAARATYDQVIAAQPQAQWARVALANLLLEQNRRDEAETLYRAVRQSDPSNRDAALGLARLLADKGDYPAAQRELSQLSGVGNDSAAAYKATVEFFDERIGRLGGLVAANRTAWEKGTLSKEALYNATTAQSGRVSGLLAILKAGAPPSGSPGAVTRSYNSRVYAATLLAQSIAALLSHLDTGDTDAGSKASVHLIEFQREMNAAHALDGTAP